LFHRRGAETQRKQKNIICRKKREERKEKLPYVFLILRIFASFAAEKYYFSAPPRLCG